MREGISYEIGQQSKMNRNTSTIIDKFMYNQIDTQRFGIKLSH